MLSHQQFSPVLVRHAASCLFDCFKSLSAFRQEFDAVLDFANYSSIFQILLSDHFAGVQVAVIDVVGQFAKVKLCKLCTVVESMWSGTKFRKPSGHWSLTAFKARSWGALTCTLSLVTITTSFSPAAARTSADTQSGRTRPYVVPKIVGCERSQNSINLLPQL